jgi:hypothetical protein
MDEVEQFDIGSPAKRLSALIASWQAHRVYTRIRNEYCSLAIALNREGRWAPAFRPTPTIPYRQNQRSSIHMTIHRDMVVIECHWLRCRGEDVWPRDREYRVIFDATAPFQVDLAASFACRNWSKLHRAEEALILTTWQQCQLKAMQGSAVSDRRVAAIDGIRKDAERIPPKIVAVRRAIREWCKKDKRMVPHRQVYEDLWLAREMLGKDASIMDIAKLGGLIAGVLPLSERTVRDKLGRLDKRIAGI